VKKIIKRIIYLLFVLTIIIWVVPEIISWILTGKTPIFDWHYNLGENI